MLNFIADKHLCTGCTACKSICPKKCITMESDLEGFLYPIKSTLCVNCGLCERVCPIQNPIQGSVNTIQLAFACKSKSYEIWKTSASGGAFTEICKCFGDSETIVFGAAYDGLQVKHIGIKGVDNIQPLRKSKYVASDLKDTFCEAKNALLDMKKVIFCGTPCQIAGIRKYLGKDYDNLLLIDFVCHGVGSQKVWRKCVDMLSSNYKKEPVAYFFREKRDFFEERYLQKIVFRDGGSAIVKNDFYQSLFLNQICLRPSCGEFCIFRDQNRQGDITLADYKNPDLDFPDQVDQRFNYTAVIFNTKKSLKLIDSLNKSADLIPSSVGNVVRDNPLFLAQTKTFTLQRNHFFKSFQANEKKAIVKWTKKTTRKNCLIKKLVKKLFFRGKK